jgi:acetyl-CoA C-acetyltransferase
VTTVCGLLTKPGLAVYAATPDGRPPLLDDLADAAAAATPMAPVVSGYHGPATVATYTVTYDGDQPAHTKIIADTPDGSRCVAVADDEDLARQAVGSELIGAPVQVDATTFTA